jgi:hypothetical protein
VLKEHRLLNILGVRGNSSLFFYSFYIQNPLYNAIYIKVGLHALFVMSSLSPLNELSNLESAASWMLTTISEYERGSLNRKEASNLAKKALKRIKKYVPKDNEKTTYEAVMDLCVSLTTIDRAMGNFEKFYLESLKEELDKIITK